MKKQIYLIVAILVMLLTIGLCSCDIVPEMNSNDSIRENEELDVLSPIEISEDGYWIINGNKTEYKAIAQNGKDGNDGVTPTIEISEDGYWVINGIKTEYSVNSVSCNCINCEHSYVDFYVIQSDCTVRKLFKSCEYCDNVISSEEIGEWHKYVDGVCTECGKVIYSAGLEYKLSQNGDYYSVIGIGNCTDANVIIPEIYNDLPVKQIGTKAFEKCTSIKSIVVPNSITSIGQSAFEKCANLSYVNIGNGVTDIPSSAFYECEKLSNIDLGSNVTSIGNSAFSHCIALTEITMPEGLTSIGEQAFWECGELTSIVLPKSLANIGDRAFYYCAALYVIYNQSELLLEIGSDDYGKLASYAKILVSEGVTTYLNDGNQYILTDEDFLFRYDGNTYTLMAYCGNSETVTFPNSINQSAYKINCMRGAVNVIIPDSIVNIDYSAFHDCNALKSVVIGNAVTSIGKEAFYYCRNFSVVTIGNSVTDMGIRAFYHCESLTNIDIPDSVTSIGEHAFSGCSNLTSATIGRSANIGNFSFSTCENLENITLCNGVTSIGDSAFYRTKISNIFIPASVTDIGDNVFSNTYLVSITVDDNNSYYKSISGNLYSKDGKILIKYAEAKLETSFVVPDGVTIIDDEAFFGCEHLESITIPNGVTNIGDYAFYDSDNLKNVIISDSVTSIGENAFRRSNSIENIIVDENNQHYKSIDGNLYSKDGKTLIQYSIGKINTSFIVPDDVINIGNYAFEEAKNITNIVIGNNVTTIGEYAFYDCKNLTNVTVGSGVTLVKGYAFSNCTSIDSVYYCGTVNEWGEISINFANTPLSAATRYYYSESEPITDGNFWHYVDGNVEIW